MAAQNIFEMRILQADDGDQMWDPNREDDCLEGEGYYDRSSKWVVGEEEVRDLQKDACLHNDWAIESLVVGDGSTGKGGKKLVKGELYASARMSGGYENCHLIDGKSLALTMVGEVGFKFPTRAVNPKKVNFARF